MQDPSQMEGQEQDHEHSDCHRKRLRRAAHFSLASVLVLTLVLFMTFKCRLDQVMFGGSHGGAAAADVNASSGLEKRQSNGSGTTGSNDGTQSSFVKNKRELYFTYAVV